MSCKIWKIILELDQRYVLTDPTRLDNVLNEIIKWQENTPANHFLPALNANTLNGIIAGDGWEDFRPFIVTFYNLLSALRQIGADNFSKISDIGTVGDTLLFSRLGVTWEGFNGSKAHANLYKLKRDLLDEQDNLSNPGALLGNHAQFFPRRFTRADCEKTNLDLVYLRNTLHHMKSWHTLLKEIHARARTGVFIMEPVFIEGLPAKFNNDIDGGKYLTVREITEISKMCKTQFFLSESSRDDLDRVLFNGFSENEFSQSHQNDDVPPNVLSIFLYPPAPPQESAR